MLVFAPRLCRCVAAKGGMRASHRVEDEFGNAGSGDVDGHHAVLAGGRRDSRGGPAGHREAGDPEAVGGEEDTGRRWRIRLP